MIENVILGILMCVAIVSGHYVIATAISIVFMMKGVF